jgi:tRNA threonylcarbamoyladenosine biosynthesis protein TsaB
MEPRLLIVETSGKGGHVAVARGGQMLASRRLEEARRHGRDLAPATGELLAQLGWKPRELAAVIVSRGPGSYTGLRVGLMSAKALAFATGCRLLAIDTFAAVALQAGENVLAVDVVADAQQDRVYVQRFARSGPDDLFSPGSELSIQPFGVWLQGRGGEAWLTGPGLGVRGRRLPEGLLTVPPEHWEPRPESLLRIGWERFRAGEGDDVWGVEPLYLRPSAAETQWEALPRGSKPSPS